MSDKIYKSELLYLCLLNFKPHNVINQRNRRSREAEKRNLKEKKEERRKWTLGEGGSETLGRREWSLCTQWLLLCMFEKLNEGSANGRKKWKNIVQRILKKNYIV